MMDLRKEPLFTAEEVEAAFKDGVTAGDRYAYHSRYTERRYAESETRRDIMAKLFEAKRGARA